mmetsp:Transcript_70454/g.86450  ORF Transcript_70454/g.86450 Transcript_70454/m.86450 type:complete len:290 (-) Transcript_70454:10-879(-)
MMLSLFLGIIGVALSTSDVELIEPYDIIISQSIEGVGQLIQPTTDFFYRDILGYNDIEYENERQLAITWFKDEFGVDFTNSILTGDNLTYAIDGTWQAIILDASKFTGAVPPLANFDLLVFGFYRYEFKRNKPILIRLKSQLPTRSNGFSAPILCIVEYTDKNGDKYEGFALGGGSGAPVNATAVQSNARITVTMRRVSSESSAKKTANNVDKRNHINIRNVMENVNDTIESKLGSDGLLVVYLFIGCVIGVIMCGCILGCQRARCRYKNVRYQQINNNDVTCSDIQTS